MAQGLGEYRKGLAIGFAGGFVLTFDVPLIRFIDADPIVIVFWRGVMLFAALALYWLVERARGRPLGPFVNGMDALVVAALYSAATFFFIFALHYTVAANALFMTAFRPFLAAIFAFMILREATSPGTWAAIAASLLGVLLIVQDGLQSGNLTGDLLGFLAALAIGLAIVVIRRSPRNMAMAPALSGLISAVIAGLLASSFALDAGQWLLMGLNGLVVMPLAFALMMAAPRYISAPEAAIFQIMEVVIAPIWVWLVIAEVPSRMSLAGGAIIVGALAANSFFNLYRIRQRRLQPEIP